jgi:hypothetical protein
MCGHPNANAPGYPAQPQNYQPGYPAPQPVHANQGYGYPQQGYAAQPPPPPGYGHPQYQQQQMPPPGPYQNPQRYVVQSSSAPQQLSADVYVCHKCTVVQPIVNERCSTCGELNPNYQEDDTAGCAWCVCCTAILACLFCPFSG